MTECSDAESDSEIEAEYERMKLVEEAGNKSTQIKTEIKTPKMPRTRKTPKMPETPKTPKPKKSMKLIKKAQLEMASDEEEEPESDGEEKGGEVSVYTID